MQRTRDWRRAQKQRYKKRVLEFLKNRSDYNRQPNPLSDWFNWTDKHGNARYLHTWHDVFEYREREANHLIKNRQICSKQCCGNPRKWWHTLTIQELRFSFDYMEEAGL